MGYGGYFSEREERKAQGERKEEMMLERER